MDIVQQKSGYDRSNIVSQQTREIGDRIMGTAKQVKKKKKQK